MRLNKLIYTALVGAGLGLALTSCSDFLDKTPDTRVELNTVEKARMKLCDAYPAYNPALTLELMSDNMEDCNTASSTGVRFNLPAYDRTDDEAFAFEEVKSGSGNDTPSGIWSGYYGAIASANAAIECLENLQAKIDNGVDVADAENLPAVMAEAKMLRAYCMFMLVNTFCEQYRGPELSEAIVGLPYPTSPETVVKPHYDRPSLAYDYEMMEKDITEALPNIDNTIYEIPRYHFNMQAAYTFAARFYLWKRDYKKVLEYTNRAFGGENVDPTQYITDIWAHIGDFYYISDFGKYIQGVDKGRNFLLIATYSTAFRHYTGGRRYHVIRDALRSTLKGPGPQWSSFNWRDSSTGETFSMHPGFNGCCGINSKSQYGSYYAGNNSEQFEYTNKIAGIGYAHVTRSEITGEECLLMRAEAKLFLGDVQGAIDDLAKWEIPKRSAPSAVGSENRFKELTLALINEFYTNYRSRYGIAKDINIDQVTPSAEYSVTADIEPVLQCIQHFRRIEQVHTGFRFFDLKRYGIEWSHKIGTENRIETMSLFDPRRAVQIPSEIQAAGFEANYRLDDEDDAGVEVYAPAD